MTAKSFPAKLAKLPQMLSWVCAQIDQTALSKREKMELEVALEEALVNVIQYSKSEMLCLKARFIPNKEIAFELSDTGPPFNPLLREEGAIDAPLESQPIGGKGLILMRKCTDALIYRREDNSNILTIIKKISPCF